MKKTLTLVFAALLLVSCNNTEKKLRERAQELCQYIPDHKLLPEAEKFITPDFYQALSAAFEAEPNNPMDHEWLFYFVTGNGGTTPIFTIDSVKMVDKTHAIAYVSVQQKRDDGALSEEAPKQHQMEMTQVQDQWLMSDFDGRKQQCIDFVTDYECHQAYVAAVTRHLTDVVGPSYAPGEVCIPCPVIIAKDESNPDDIRVWGDFWVFNYNIKGDTLVTVSGGDHPGLMHLRKDGNGYKMNLFEQVEDGAGNKASAHRIFDTHFEEFWKINSDEQAREVKRIAATAKYAREHNLSVHYIQDYGWPAVKIQ